MQSQITKYKNSKKNNSNKICLAPFASLRFTVSGNIQVCCFNRLYLLGKYPDTSIYEAWHGKKHEILKSAIENSDLTLGCGYCKESIENGLFKSVGANNYDYLQLDNNEQNPMPTMFDFELGNNCNLECIMCNGENSALIRKNRENKLPYNPPYDITFIKQLDEFIPHLKEARFVGGEPFLIDLNYQIWERIIELNPSCKITILTNCTILNNKIKTLLTKGHFEVSVSADGITKTTYEKIRKNANFEEFKINLDYFIKHSKLIKYTTFLNFCPMIHNWFEIPGMYKFCNKNNIQIITHTVIFPPNSALWTLPQNKLEEIRTFLIKNNPKELISKKITKTNNISYLSLINQITNWIENSKTNNNNQLSFIELKNNFNKKLLNYFNNSKMYDDETKKINYKNNVSKIENILSQLDEMSSIKVLNFLISFSTELIIAELENSTTDKVSERLKYGIK